jgi:hypothetical protein
MKKILSFLCLSVTVICGSFLAAKYHFTADDILYLVLMSVLSFVAGDLKRL